MTNFNTHGQDLDGKGKIEPTPFDAHERNVRDVEPGKKQEYPKAVDHVDHPSGVGKQPVIVNSAEEEKVHEAAKAAEKKADEVPAATE